MSRIGKLPVNIPAGVTVTMKDNVVSVKGPKGELSQAVDPSIIVTIENNEITFAIDEANDTVEQKQKQAFHGLYRALVNNMVVGVSEGYTRKLELVGVGYRAKAEGKVLNLSLGFSHPVAFEVPAGITIETPSQTEVLVKGADKQLVGQVAANIRAYRKPEPYKGKGVRYANENVRRKEAKKK